MIKKGFTLAEILVALTIIGVVAAMTIPTLVEENQKKILATTLASTASSVENALTTMIMKEDAYTLKETSFYNNNNNITTYLNAEQSGGVFVLRSGAEIKFSKNEKSKFNDKDALDAGTELTKILFNMDVDVNGKDKKPNKPGRDQFKYAVGEDGRLYPYGGHDLYIFDGSGKENPSTWDCPSAGVNCTGRVAENGYKMDY